MNVLACALAVTVIASCAAGSSTVPAATAPQIVGLDMTYTERSLREARRAEGERQAQVEASYRAANAAGRDMFCDPDAWQRAEARKRAHAAFFARWTPAQVPAGCKGRPREATLEAVAIHDEHALEAARPALAECMTQHGVETPLSIAIAIETNGCVSAAMAEREPRNAALDACLAQALAAIALEPREQREQTFFGAPASARVPRADLRRPMRLTPVHSTCPTRGVVPTAEAPVRQEVHEARLSMTPGVRRCMEREGVSGPLELALNVEGKTGRIVGAAVVADPRLPELDACVAEAAATICFFPFEAPARWSPYWSPHRTMFMIDAGPRYEEQLAPVKTSCLNLEPTEIVERLSHDDLAQAVRSALPSLRACFATHQQPIREEVRIDVAIDRALGGIVGAAAHYIPRRPALDACLAAALKDVCVPALKTSSARFDEPYRTSFALEP